MPWWWTENAASKASTPLALRRRGTIPHGIQLCYSCSNPACHHNNLTFLSERGGIFALTKPSNGHLSAPSNVSGAESSHTCNTIQGRASSAVFYKLELWHRRCNQLIIRRIRGRPLRCKHRQSTRRTPTLTRAPRGCHHRQRYRGDDLPPAMLSAGGAFRFLFEKVCAQLSRGPALE